MLSVHELVNTPADFSDSPSFSNDCFVYLLGHNLCLIHSVNVESILLIVSSCHEAVFRNSFGYSSGFANALFGSLMKYYEAWIAHSSFEFHLYGACNAVYQNVIE